MLEQLVEYIRANFAGPLLYEYSSAVRFVLSIVICSTVFLGTTPNVVITAIIWTLRDH